MPPTENSVVEHIKRANYQCYIWKHALKQVISVESPIGNGWEADISGNLLPKLMTKDPAPDGLAELVTCSCQKGCRKRCSCRSVNMSCSRACKCDLDCANVEICLDDERDMD